MSHFTRHWAALLAIAVMAIAAGGITACSSGAGTQQTSLVVIATFDGHDVTGGSSGMIADANGAFVGRLQLRHDGLAAALAPGHYKVLVSYQGSDADMPPMKLLEVQLRPGQTTRETVELQKTPSMAAMQFLRTMTLQAALKQSNAAIQAGTGAAMPGLGGSGYNPARVSVFAACAGLPTDYFGDPGQPAPGVAGAEPKLTLPTPTPLVFKAPPNAPPVQLQAYTMAFRSHEATGYAKAIEQTMEQLPATIGWGDWKGADQLLAHVAELMPRMTDAGKASRAAEASLLRAEIVPLLQPNPPAMFNADDPMGMTHAFAEWQRQVKQHGLPAGAVAKLKAGGWTDAQIAAMTTQATQASAGHVVMGLLVNTVLVTKRVRGEEQAYGKQIEAAKAELDQLRKGVSRCGAKR